MYETIQSYCETKWCNLAVLIFIIVFNSQLDIHDFM